MPSIHHTLILISLTMVAAAVAQAADVHRSSTCCDYERPSGVKLFVEQDRMYQVTGADIEQAIRNSNRSLHSEDIVGDELFVDESAAGNAANDGPNASGFTPGNETDVSVIDASSELGDVAVGRYAVRVAGRADQSSSVHVNGAAGEPGITMSSGRRYEVSFRLYCNSPDAEFVANLSSDISNFVWLRNTVNNHPDIVIEPGRWNEVRAWVEMPDVGDHVCIFAVTERKGTPDAWYLDGFSVRRWEKKTTAVAVRGKSEAEERLTLDAIPAAGLNLYYKGETVPILVDRVTSDGTLAHDTTITFWGSYPRGENTDRNPFTKENAFVLRFDASDPPNRFRRIDLTDAGTSKRTYRETWFKTARIERNKLVQYYQAYKGLATDRVFWTEFKSPHRTAGKRLQLESLADLAPGKKPTEMRFSLWGNSDLPKTPDHDWSVQLNGGLLGHARWDGPSQYTFTSGVVDGPYRIRGEAENRIKNGSFEILLNDGTPSSWYVVPGEMNLGATADGVNAATGERILALKSPENDQNEWGVVAQMLPSLEKKAGERIRVSVRCRTSNKRAGVISIAYSANGKPQELVAELLPNPSGTWQEIETVATIPRNIDAGTLRARIVLRPMAGDATVYIDDFRVSLEAERHLVPQNELHFTNNHVDGTVDSIALDWIEMDYEATFKPGDGSLEFELDPEYNNFAIRTATGFSHGPILLFDRTAGAACNLPSTRDKNERSFRTQYEYAFDTGPRRFRIAGADGFLKPERMLVAHECGLGDVSESPQYVVITHRDFRDALTPLMKHRQQQGLTTMLVDVEHIYDRYSDGLFSAEAIRAFIDELIAKSERGEGQLQYVFLVGDASYDYMQLKKGSPNFVPTHHVYGGNTLLEDFAVLAATQAEDEYFAYGRGEGKLPRVAVGRIPCANAQSVKDYVNKVLQYESTGPMSDRDWARNAVVVSSGDFVYAANDVIKSLTGDWDITQIVGTEDAESDDLKREETLQAIDRGCSVLTFVGHGGYYMWRLRGTITGTPDLISPKEVERLNNTDRYPIIFTVTCFSALFDAPIHTWSHSDSGIGVYFVQAREQGAIALIGGVGKVYVSHATAFSRRVLDDLMTGSVIRLGDAFLAARRALPGQNYAGIALLGDPALRVQEIFSGPADAGVPADRGKI